MFRAQLRRRPSGPLFNACRKSLVSSYASVKPVVRLQKATIYKDNPDQKDATPIFRDLNFTLPTAGECWAVVSSSSSARTGFLQVLNGRCLCTPPDARSYPYLIWRKSLPEHAISYVGFDAERDGLGGTAVKGAYLSSRYESHREVTDWSLLNYLEGNTELNALEKEDSVDTQLLAKVIADLNLEPLLQLPVSNLSNGQTRRARIAKALLAKPELLLLDGPFMGLDPRTQLSISSFLQDLAQNNNPRVILSLRPEDEIPDWITHVLFISPGNKVLLHGDREKVFLSIPQTGVKAGEARLTWQAFRSNLKPRLRGIRAKPSERNLSRDAFHFTHSPLPVGEPLVEMQGVKVSYSANDKPTRRTVLGDWSESVDGSQKEGLWWNIRRGERWGVFGPNGSGKTTLLSLITSDHPQTYGLPIKLFGRSRIPSPGELGISIFELQSRIGHSSPEVHTYFPKHLSVRRVLESAWADTPLSKPRLTHQHDCRVDAFLRWFAPELSPTGISELQSILNGCMRGNWRRSGEMRTRLEGLLVRNNDLDWADSTTFRDLSFSSQRLILFLRAIVSNPDLIILDEALSGMDKHVRDKCLLFLSHGEKIQFKGKSQANSAGTRFVKSLQTDNDMVNFGGLEDRQALLTISHSKEDIPGCIRQWICLPEPGEGKPARVGELPGPLEFNVNGWEHIWNLPLPEPPAKRGQYKRVPGVHRSSSDSRSRSRAEGEEQEQEQGEEEVEGAVHDHRPQ